MTDEKTDKATFEADAVNLFSEIDKSGGDSSEPMVETSTPAPEAPPTPPPVVEYDIEGKKYKADEVVGWRSRAEAASKYEQELADWKRRESEFKQHDAEWKELGGLSEVAKARAKWGPNAAAFDAHMARAIENFGQQVHGQQIDPAIWGVVGPMQQQLQEMKQIEAQRQQQAEQSFWQGAGEHVFSNFKTKHGFELNVAQVDAVLSAWDRSGRKQNINEVADGFYGSIFAHVKNSGATSGNGAKEKAGAVGPAPTRGEPPPAKSRESMSPAERRKAFADDAVAMFKPD